MIRKNIRDYIDSHDFSYLLLKQKEVGSLFSNIPQENIIKFVNEFWYNPRTSINGLKKKHHIPHGASYIDLIIAYPTEEYVSFLIDCWNTNISINAIQNKYVLTYERIDKLLSPMIFISDQYVCPHCLKSSSFLLTGTIAYIKAGKYDMYCNKCKEYIFDENLLEKEQAEYQLEAMQKKQLEFEDDVNEATNVLEDINCPRCSGDNLKLEIEISRYSYSIKCLKCNETWDKLKDLTNDYEKFKKRAAAMIAIKEKEKEMLDEIIKNREIKEAICKNEDIITEQEGYGTVDFIIENEENDVLKLSQELFKKVRNMNRMQKILLEKICELCLESNEKVMWNSGDKKAQFYQYSPKEPIAPQLSIITGLIPIRKLLRKLINLNLIVCCEVGNFINVPVFLVNNLDKISNMLKLSSVENEIKYIVLKRHHYMCSHCGETGRPLKIAFLTVFKNPNELNTMIPICDMCFDEITEDDILIGGMISSEDIDSGMKYQQQSEEFASWLFLIYHYPELKDDQKTYRKITELTAEYSEEDIIKALAITLYQIENDQIDSSTITLLQYSGGILRRSVDKGVIINKSIAKEYDINRWIDLI